MSSPPRIRLWLFVATTALAAATASGFVLFQIWSEPVETTPDQFSALTELALKVVTVAVVIACSGAGALVGWLIGRLIRILGPSHS